MKKYLILIGILLVTTKTYANEKVKFIYISSLISETEIIRGEECCYYNLTCSIVNNSNKDFDFCNTICPWTKVFLFDRDIIEESIVCTYNVNSVNKVKAHSTYEYKTTFYIKKKLVEKKERVIKIGFVHFNKNEFNEFCRGSFNLVKDSQKANTVINLGITSSKIWKKKIKNNKDIYYGYLKIKL